MSQAVQNIFNHQLWTRPSRRGRKRNPRGDLSSGLPKQLLKHWICNQKKSNQAELEEQRTKNSSSEKELKMNIISKPYFQQKAIHLNHGNKRHIFQSWSYKIQVGDTIIELQILANSSLELAELEKSHTYIFQNFKNSCILYCKNESRSNYNRFLFAFSLFQNIRQIILNKLETYNMPKESADKSLYESLSGFFVNINQQTTFWDSKIIMKMSVSSGIEIEKDLFMRSQNQLGPFLTWPKYCSYYIKKYNVLDELLFHGQLLEEIKASFKKQKCGRIICSYIRDNLHEILKQLQDIFYFIKENPHKHNPILNQYTLWKEKLFGKIKAQERYYAQRRLNDYWVPACMEQLKKLLKFVIKAASCYTDQDLQDSKGLFIATKNNLYNFWKSLKKLQKLNLKLSKSKDQRFDYLEDFIITCLNRFVKELQKVQFEPSDYISIFLQKKIIFLVVSYANISKIISNKQNFKAGIHYIVKEKIIQKLQEFKQIYADIIQNLERRDNYQKSLKTMKQIWKDLNHFCEIARKKGEMLQENEDEEVFFYIFIDIVGQDILDCQEKGAFIKGK